MKIINNKIISFFVFLCLVLTISFISNLSVMRTKSKMEQPQSGNIVKIQYDYQPYMDLKTMKNDAGAIFQGSVVKISGPVTLIEYYISDNKDRPSYAPYMISDIQVEKVIKGDLKPGDIIQIKQIGGTLDGDIWTSADETMLSEGTQGIFFTDKYRVHEVYPSSLLLFKQGLFVVKNGIIMPNQLQENLLINTEMYSDSLITNINTDNFVKYLESLI